MNPKTLLITQIINLVIQVGNLLTLSESHPEISIIISLASYCYSLYAVVAVAGVAVAAGVAAGVAVAGAVAGTGAVAAGVAAGVAVAGAVAGTGAVAIATVAGAVAGTGAVAAAVAYLLEDEDTKPTRKSKVGKWQKH